MTANNPAPASFRDSSRVASAPASERRRASLDSLVHRTDAEIRRSTIMVVDDEFVNVKIVRKHLKDAGYENFITTTDSREALPLIQQQHPDVLILDLMMPHVDGFQILDAIRRDGELRHLPVLFLTASDDTQTKLNALDLGATDFLRKPVDPTELVVRVRNVLRVKRHLDQLADYSTRLEKEVLARTQELDESRAEVIHALAVAGEQRDQETGNHVIRVARYCGILAHELGLDPAQADLLELTAVLHDVGKIGIPDAILLKPGALDEAEYAMMQQHCEFGMNILMGVACRTHELTKTCLGQRRLSRSPILRNAAMIAMSHHEKWDGTGYPSGLKGEAIPIEGRICAVADVFDALSTRRPYKPALPWKRCHEILEEGRGSHFDPRVLDAFFARHADIREVQLRYADPA